MLIFLSFIYGVAFFFAHHVFPVTSLLFSTVVLIPFICCKFLRNASKSTHNSLRSVLYLSICIAAGLLGFFYSCYRQVPQTPLADLAGETIEIIGIAQSEPAFLDKMPDKISQVVSVESARYRDNTPLNLRDIRLMSDTVFKHDRKYRIAVAISKEAYLQNPGTMPMMVSGYAREAREIEFREMGLFERARRNLNHCIKEKFSSQSAPFLMSQITGERSLLPAEVRLAFNVTGLAHLLSISGTHFGLLFLVLFNILNLLLKVIPYHFFVRLTVYFTPSQIASVLCMPLMLLYLGISDMSTPAVRSFIMITFFLFGLLIQRRGFWLNTLLLAAVIILVVQPDSLLDLSFQLSFIAVLCIGMVAERTDKEKKDHHAEGIEKQKFHEKMMKKTWSFVKSSLSISLSLAATLGTAPLVAYYFHYFSLISPLTNLIITPFVGLFLLPIALLSSFIYLAVGIFPLHSLIDEATAVLLNIIIGMGQWHIVDVKIPAFPPILLMTFYAAVILYVVKIVEAARSNGQNRKGMVSKGNAILLFCLALVPFIIYAIISFHRTGETCVTHLDVGQGDAAVIELSDKRVVVIDTGRTGFQVAGFLKYLGVRKIDALILTHEHPDHADGLRYLSDNFVIAELWDNDRLSYAPEILRDIKRRGLQRGDTFQGQGYRITVLHPYRGFYARTSRDSDGNNDSLVVKCVFGRVSYLFAGDIQREAEEDLSHLKGHLKSDVLKVPHHGSRYSLSEEFLHNVSPSSAVISVGLGNIYGFPHPETLEQLRNMLVLRTDKDGAVRVRILSDGNLDINTWKQFRLERTSNVKDELMNLKKLFIVW